MAGMCEVWRDILGASHGPEFVLLTPLWSWHLGLADCGDARRLPSGDDLRRSCGEIRCRQNDCTSSFAASGSAAAESESPALKARGDFRSRQGDSGDRESAHRGDHARSSPAAGYQIAVWGFEKETYRLRYASLCRTIPVHQIDQPNTGPPGIVERHRRARVGFHRVDKNLTLGICAGSRLGVESRLRNPVPDHRAAGRIPGALPTLGQLGGLPQRGPLLFADEASDGAD